MIALDEIRRGFTDADPAKHFDGLVRRELAAGRKVRDVYQEMSSHLSEIQTWSDYDDSQAREDFHGILDGLSGNCRREQRYADDPYVESVAAEIERVPAADRLRVLETVTRRVRAMS